MTDTLTAPVLDDDFAGQALHRADGSVAARGRWNPKALFDVLTPDPDYWRGKRVLDNGANTLGLPLMLARAGAEVVALEPDPRDRMAERHKLALQMAADEGLKLTVHRAELFDAHEYGAFDEVLCLGILYHLRYPQFTIDYLSTLDTKTIVLATQTHASGANERLALFNRKDTTVWPGTQGTEPLLLTGWHPTRPLLKLMMEWGGFTDIQSLTDESFDFPSKPVKGLTNTAYYRARKARTVDPFKAYREFYP